MRVSAGTARSVVKLVMAGNIDAIYVGITGTAFCTATPIGGLPCNVIRQSDVLSR